MTIDRLLTSLQSAKPVAGLTHNFYRYPARMSPELAHEVIWSFSQTRDIVLDPFVGGGTSVVEAVAAGRQAIGIDLNPLAVFVTKVKTTPLSFHDQEIIQRWANEVDSTISATDDPNGVIPDAYEQRAKNLPEPVRRFFLHALKRVATLPFARQKQFARCVLLRLGQWAVDCKISTPEHPQLVDKFHIMLDDMLSGLAQYVTSAQTHGFASNRLTRQRTLLLRSIIDAHNDLRLKDVVGKPKLVLTSPPYPGVHVLYHRWQVEGRRETPAPYWLIDAQDGHGAAYYTLGSRTGFGLKNYFQRITDAYRSIREIIHPDALIVQLVAFSDTQSQLPAFLEAMKQAGYYEDCPATIGQANLWRNVPHRKWYNYIGTARDSEQELLLFHRSAQKP